MALLRCVKCGKTERKPVVYGYPDPGTMKRAAERWRERMDGAEGE